MKSEEHCDGFLCDIDYHLHCFCLFKGIVTAKQCMDCRKKKSYIREIIQKEYLEGENK